MGCSRKIRAERVISLGLVLVVLSTIALADEEDSTKPEGWDERLEKLRAVPYLGFSEAEADEDQAGVIFCNPDKACDGYNLFCSKTLGEVLLLDMDGQVVHRWTYSSQAEKEMGSDHAVMLDNGDVMVIERGILLRLSWDSEVIWRRKLRAHHDVAWAPDGSFYVVVREGKDHRGLKVRFSAIVYVEAAGEEIDRWSSHDRLDDLMGVLDTRSFLDTILDSIHAGWSPKGHDLDEIKAAGEPGRHRYDYFHMNSVSLLPSTPLGERDSRFRRGNLLVCLRNVNQIALLERGTYRPLWAWGEGKLQWPHHPTMLGNGHILIFDNGVQRKFSRVVELDPIDEKIVWEYLADPPESFYSFGRGSAQRLPNGNTLICEGDKGRAFEVTKEGEVVWEWLNPIMENRRRANVYRMMRLPAAQVEKLLGEPSP